MEDDAAKAGSRGDEHFHYHAFPRRWRRDSASNSKGLAILASIARSGLLLAPERLPWPGEFKPHGRRGDSPISYTKRACFTYLTPRQVGAHAQDFGAFAVEWDNWNLRILGGIPVFYIPIGDQFVGFLGMGLMIPSRLADFTELLERLDTMLSIAETWSNPTAELSFVKLANDGVSIVPAGEPDKSIVMGPELFNRIRRDKPDFSFDKDLKNSATIGGNATCVLTLLRLLTWALQPFREQLAAVRGIAGFFYPTERPGKDGLMTYYHQREWRILSDYTREGAMASRELTADEKQSLFAIDQEFFGRSIELRSGRLAKCIDECRYLTNVEGKHVLSYARRVIAPQAEVGSARDVLDGAGFTELPVVATESLGT